MAGIVKRGKVPRHKTQGQGSRLTGTRLWTPDTEPLTYLIIYPMLPENLEAQIEAETVALNRWIFDEGIGLEVPANGFAPHTKALERLYARALAMNGQHPGLHQFALDNWAEIRRVPHDYR